MCVSECELLMVSCHKYSQCYGTGNCLSMSETHTSTEVGVRNENLEKGGVHQGKAR